MKHYLYKSHDSEIIKGFSVSDRLKESPSILSVNVKNDAKSVMEIVYRFYSDIVTYMNVQSSFY